MAKKDEGDKSHKAKPLGSQHSHLFGKRADKRLTGGPISPEELDEILEEHKRAIDEEPFSPHEIGRDYPVEEE
jgi:hypothetical protein